MQLNGFEILLDWPLRQALRLISIFCTVGNSGFTINHIPMHQHLGALLRDEENDAASVAPTPNYAVAFRPMTGIIFGMRHALAPYPLRRRFLPLLPWGADDAGGRSALHRDEWGVRGV